MRLATFVLLIVGYIALVLLIILATPSGAPHQMFPASGTVLRGAPHAKPPLLPRGYGRSFLVRPRSSTDATVVAAPRYSGIATWYCSTIATCTHGYRPDDLIAAIDRKDSPFRQGDRVTVRAFGRAVTVTIVDTCACGGTRLIDLSKAAFARLANPDLGVIPVTLELADAPLPTGPATDVGP